MHIVLYMELMGLYRTIPFTKEPLKNNIFNSVLVEGIRLFLIIHNLLFGLNIF